MTTEELKNLEDKIAGKLKRVTDYGKSIQHRDFGFELEGGKNAMAAAVCFQSYWREFIQFWMSLAEVGKEIPEKRMQEVNEKFDFLLNIITASSSTWQKFWNGKLPIDPSKVPFHNLETNQDEYINLFEVERIHISLS